MTLIPVLGRFASALAGCFAQIAVIPRRRAKWVKSDLSGDLVHFCESRTSRGRVLPLGALRRLQLWSVFRSASISIVPTVENVSDTA